ncbi:MAG: hypothetical protein ACLQBB_10580 [Solirubrobacteraceae bacterium]
MRTRPVVAAVLLLGMLALPAAAAEQSAGTAEQIAWVRRAAGKFLAAELQGNGPGACAVLNAPLRTVQGHRDCQQRWSSRLAAMRRDPADAAMLRSDRRALASATVEVHGGHASIALPYPLLGPSSRLVWTEMCWMVQG